MHSAVLLSATKFSQLFLNHGSVQPCMLPVDCGHRVVGSAVVDMGTFAHFVLRTRFIKRSFHTLFHSSEALHTIYN